MQDFIHIGQEDSQRVLLSVPIKAARALLGWDQRELAESAGGAVPTIRRMEASEHNVRGNVDTLVLVVEASQRGGVELIAEGATSSGSGRGVRLNS